MAEELVDLCGKISLTEGERIGIQVDELEVSDDRIVAGKCLVGKVWADKTINREAFQSVMSTVWRTSGGVKFQALKDNVWIFEFSDLADKRRVMEGRPWSFDRHILVLNEFNGSIPPSQFEFKRSPFWIQVHDMPLICMNKSIGMKIGNSLGEPIDVDVAGDGRGWGSYLRLRVDIDLMKPLDRGRALNLAGKSSWVEFKYEKLPLLCFRCGRIVHEPRGCPIIPEARLHKEEGTKAWGSWLRAFEPKRKGGRGGSGYTENSGNSQFREEEEADGAQSEEQFSGKENSGSQGNPTRRPNSSMPAGHTDSGNHLHEKSAESQIRQEISSHIMKGGAVSNDTGRIWAASQRELFSTGLDLVNDEEMGLGFLGDKRDVGSGASGPNGLEQELTSMEYMYTGPVDSRTVAVITGASEPKPTLKTWKRMARKSSTASINSQSKRMAKQGKRYSVGNVDERGEQNGKKLKYVEGTQADPVKILAEAVEQPRQEP
jgi:hypothetical protein